jgi:hypothetical protein
VSVCLYICMYACMYVCIYLYVACVCICMYELYVCIVCMYACVCVCMCACMYVCCMYLCMYLWVGQCICMYSRYLRNFTGGRVYSPVDGTNFYFSGKFAQDSENTTYLHATSNINGTGKKAEFAYDIHGCLIAERLAGSNFESVIFKYPPIKDFDTGVSKQDDVTNVRGINYVPHIDEDGNVLFEETFSFYAWENFYSPDEPKYVWNFKFAADKNGFVYYLMEGEKGVYVELVFNPERELNAVRMPDSKFFRYINYEVHMEHEKINSEEFVFHLNHIMNNNAVVWDETTEQTTDAAIGGANTSILMNTPVLHSGVIHAGNRIPADSAIGKAFAGMPALYAQRMQVMQGK